MQNECYKIPPAFGKLLKLEKLDKLSVQDSIKQNIALYLGTRPGEFHFAPSYGCILHTFNFQELNSTPKKDELKQSIENYLNDFDPRLKMDLVEVDVKDMTGSRRILILIQCRLRQTNEMLPEMKFELVRKS